MTTRSYACRSERLNRAWHLRREELYFAFLQKTDKTLPPATHNACCFYQPRVCSICASFILETASPFIELGTSALTSSSTLGSLK